MKEKWKEIPFGNGIDYVGAVIRGIVIYSVLMVMAFWGYQDGKGDFRPYVYAVLVLGMSVICSWCFHRKDGVIPKYRLVCAALAVLFWSVSAGYMGESPVCFAFAGILILADEVFCYQYYRGEKGISLKRFRLNRYYVRYGAVIWFSAIFLLAESSEPSEDFPISAQTAVHYLVYAFMAYLVCGIALKYFYEEYQHFRNREQVQEKTITTTHRMNRSVLAMIAVCFVSVLALFQETLVSLFGDIVRYILVILAKILFLGFDLMDLSWFKNLFGTGVGAGAGSGVPEGQPASASAYGDEMNYIFMGIGVLIVVILLMVVFHFYKRNGASYVLGGEEAVYLDAGVLSSSKKRRKQTSKKVDLGNGNAGKIRRMFYKKINDNITREQAKCAETKTAREIVKEYNYCKEMSELTEYYEKARYGEACTDEDVKRAEQLFVQDQKSTL